MKSSTAPFWIPGVFSNHLNDNLAKEPGRQDPDTPGVMRLNIAFNFPEVPPFNAGVGLAPTFVQWRQPAEPPLRVNTGTGGPRTPICES